MNNKNPQSRTVLITGCSSGIGYCAAHTLQQRGYRVVASARSPEDVERLRGEGLTSIPLDLSDSDSIKHGVKQALHIGDGQLYALFNNAGYGQPGAVEDLSRAVLREQFETNVFGTVELSNLVLRAMRTQGYGRIIQNSSVLGRVSLPFRGAYNASKYALEGISDTLRLELHDTQIYVSLIEPGAIESRFRANAFAMYKKNIQPADSPFREKYQRMENRLTKQGATTPFTLPPEAVVKKLLLALESPRPKARYFVTFPTYMFAFLKYLLTDRAMDKVLDKVCSSEHR